jgi:flagellar protein FlgJ
MLRPDALLPTPATAPTAGISVQQAAGGGAGFGALFAEVQADVSDFIEHGSPAGEAGALAAFSSEGAARFDGTQATASTPSGAGVDPAQADEFLASIAPWAEEAGHQLGVAPDLVAAHAALESGWGQRPVRSADGADTHNLFGIKAGTSWRGDVAQAQTTEYVQGAPVATKDGFRSYPDTATAFRDYAQVLATNPRFRGALNAGGDARAFAEGLARGGYATDPAYAEKLSRVAARIQSRE